MKYRKFGRTGFKVSALGFGCMRLPLVTGEDGKQSVDTPAAVSLLRHAIDRGVDYFDTAFGYHNSESEVVVGHALRDGYREKVRVATKFPCWDFKKKGDFERVLEIQLGRLQTSYIDCYMLHGLSADSFGQIAVKAGVLERLVAAKREGVVKNIGFSFHDNLETFKRIVDYTDVWDFCQIQYNYMDTANQAGTEGMRHAAAKGLAVIAMEPLLGGKLADKMPAKIAKFFDGTGKTNTEWALDFLWNQPEISMALSGMGSKQMVDDNIKYANRSKIGMLKPEDMKFIAKARQALAGNDAVPCTGCEYCLPVCPKKLPIPAIFHTYNEFARTKDLGKFNERVPAGSSPADCVACAQCEKRCPQKICIGKEMKKIAKKVK